MSVPNQKTIIIERSSENVKKDFLKVSNQNLYLSMYNLSASAFMLWIYFTDNKNGYQFPLYPVDFTNKSRLSRSTYDRAFKELEEKGYLIKSKNKKNLYLFKEKSDKDIEEQDNIISLNENDLEIIKQQYFNNES